VTPHPQHAAGQFWAANGAVKTIRHLKLACNTTDEGWTQAMQALAAVVPRASAARRPRGWVAR